MTINKPTNIDFNLQIDNIKTLITQNNIDKALDAAKHFALSQAGDKDDDEFDYIDSIISLCPNNIKFYLLYLEIYKNFSYTQRKKVLKLLVKSFPKDIVAYTEAIQNIRFLDWNDLKDEIFDLACLNLTDNIAGLQELAFLAIDVMKYKVAESIYLTLISTYPDNPAGYSGMLSLYIHTRDQRCLSNYFERMCLISDNFENLELNRGILCGAVNFAQKHGIQGLTEYLSTNKQNKTSLSQKEIIKDFFHNCLGKRICLFDDYCHNCVAVYKSEYHDIQVIINLLIFLFGKNDIKQLDEHEFVIINQNSPDYLLEVLLENNLEVDSLAMFLEENQSLSINSLLLVVYCKYYMQIKNAIDFSKQLIIRKPHDGIKAHSSLRRIKELVKENSDVNFYFIKSVILYNEKSLFLPEAFFPFIIQEDTVLVAHEEFQCPNLTRKKIGIFHSLQYTLDKIDFSKEQMSVEQEKEVFYNICRSSRLSASRYDYTFTEVNKRFLKHYNKAYDQFAVKNHPLRIIATGYLRLTSIKKKLQRITCDTDTILVIPHTTFSLELISALIGATKILKKFKLLYRFPWLNSKCKKEYAKQYEGLKYLQQECALEISTDFDYTSQYARSLFCITDGSGGMYSYAMGAEKPVVNVRSIFNGLNEVIYGYDTNAANFNESIKRVIDTSNRDDFVSKIRFWRERYFANVDNSDEFAAARILEIANDLPTPDTLTIEGSAVDFSAF